MKQREKIIENEILEYLARRNIFSWKVKTVGTYDPVKKQFRKASKYYLRGQPDISAILPGGQFLGLEVKSEKGRASIFQKEFLRRIVEAGGIGAVVRSVDEVALILDQAKAT